MKQPGTGITTGLCAAAAAKAAATTLFSTARISTVEVSAKNGRAISLEVIDTVIENGVVKCAVLKDAGDDPDVTSGMKIFAAVSKRDAVGIEVDGDEGVGRVTKPGLKVPVGKAAINPVPMEMIKSAVSDVCGLYGYTGGINVVVSIPGGEEVAEKTMNKRLGVIGGLSVLGTTGIVEPVSTRAIVETIKAEIDVAVATGKKALLLTPGNYGQEFAKSALGFDINDAVKISNFIGEALDYVYLKGIKRIILIGHAGKLVKLAGGIMNTHSSTADCRTEIITAHTALCGAGADVSKQLMECVTTEAAIDILKELGINELVWESIGRKIGFHLNERVSAARRRDRASGNIMIEYIVFTQEHGVLVRGKVGARS